MPTTAPIFAPAALPLSSKGDAQAGELKPLTHPLDHDLTVYDPLRESWWHMLVDAAREWSDVRASTMGAALAYYTVFSIAPLLLIVVSLAGLFLGAEAVSGELANQLKGLLGQDGAQLIESLVASVNRPATGLMSSLVGAALMAFGATTVLSELEESLNAIWRTPANPDASGIMGFFRKRLLSFGIIVATGFLLIVSLALSTALAMLEKGWLPWLGRVGDHPMLLATLNHLIGLVPTTLMFAVVYKVLPRVRLHWRDVWVGALFTALLFALGRWAIGQYIGRSGMASGFGASASLVVLLMWVYYSAQIFLFGASFTRVYALNRGSLKGDTHRVRLKG